MATTAEPRTFASIEDAIEDVRNGKCVVVVDNPNRGHRLHHQYLKFETGET
jgi:hypothetical protein